MAKRKSGVKEVAIALRCSKAYVSEVLNGTKEDNSPLAKRIKAAHNNLPIIKKELLRELRKKSRN